MTREGLTAAGVDYAGGVRRFAGKEPLYEKYLGKFFADDSFAHLQEELERGDNEAAFGIAHDLKGVAGNLSMDRLYHVMCQLVELLRTGDGDREARLLCQEARDLYEQAKLAAKDL